MVRVCELAVVGLRCFLEWLKVGAARCVYVSVLRDTPEAAVRRLQVNAVLVPVQLEAAQLQFMVVAGMCGVLVLGWQH